MLLDKNLKAPFIFNPPFIYSSQGFFKVSISKMSHCHYLIITGKFGVYDGNSLIPIIALKTNGIVSVENIN